MALSFPFIIILTGVIQDLDASCLDYGKNLQSISSPLDSL